MKKMFAGIIMLVIFVFVFTSGLFEGLVNFLVWLVTLNMTQSKVSMAGEIFVKIATWVISYSAVGFVFGALRWYDKDAMKGLYFVISTLVSFALCYVVMLLETYLLVLVIITGVLLIAAIVVGILLLLKNRKRRKMENGNNRKTV